LSIFDGLAVTVTDLGGIRKKNCENGCSMGRVMGFCRPEKRKPAFFEEAGHSKRGEAIQ
jgi:hypothetical protein